MEDLRLDSKLYNIANTIRCVKVGKVFSIKVRRGTSLNEETLLSCFDEFHARALLRGVREMYGLPMNKLDEGDYFFQQIERSVKSFQKLKKVGHKPAPNDWAAAAARLTLSLNKKRKKK